jgi:hypothetical protein
MPAKLLQPVVLLRGQLDDIHALHNEIDERQEKLAVEAVLVKRARRGVRGRHHDDAALKQVLKQPPEDHRVGNVRHLQLVEAQQPRFCGNAVGNERYWIAVDGLARLADALVHVGHELVEVVTPLGRECDAGKEHVHKHRLAAPDAAVHVEPARELCAGAEQRHEPAARCAPRA